MPERKGPRAVDDGWIKRSLTERFGAPPVSVLDSRQGYWKTRRTAWLNLGIRGWEGRREGLTGSAGPSAFLDHIEGRGPIDERVTWRPGTSTFDPMLTELLVRWYSAPGHKVLDPFAGGSTRGLVTACLDRHYTGVDIRPEQTIANQTQAAELAATGTLPDNHTPRWITGDARHTATLAAGDAYDLLLTCPPYWRAERYSDLPEDLSTAETYDEFLAGYQQTLTSSTQLMTPNAFAAIVTAPIRDNAGYILDLPSDTSGIMTGLGWRTYQQAILVTAIGPAAIRAGRSLETLRKLPAVHQNVTIYHRGNIGAVRSWPAPELQADSHPKQTPTAEPMQTTILTDTKATTR